MRNSGYIYLAQPYSHEDDLIIQHRVNEAFKATARLMAQGKVVFSPIVHTHELSQYVPQRLAQSHAFWMEQDIAILRHASELYVLMLPGWLQSKGVAEELEIAHICGIPITYLEAE